MNEDGVAPPVQPPEVQLIVEPGDRLGLAQWAARFPNQFVYAEWLARVHYRGGRFGEAVRQLDRALALHATEQWAAEAWLVLALAHHRLGHRAEARRWLDKATGWLDREVRERPRWAAPLHWTLRVKLLTLEREAVTLIREPKP